MAVEKRIHNPAAMDPSVRWDVGSVRSSHRNILHFQSLTIDPAT